MKTISVRADNTIEFITDEQLFHFSALLQALRLSKGEAAFNADLGVPYRDALQGSLPLEPFIQDTINRFSPFFQSVNLEPIAQIDPTIKQFRITVRLFSGQTLEGVVSNG